MRKPVWIGRRVMQTPWQRWSFALVSISGLGTLLAGFTLAFDGWIDALALYAVCVLMLALMLSHLGGQRMQPRLAAFTDDDGAGTGGRPAGLALTGTPGTWAGADCAAVPAVPGSAAATD